MRQHTILLVGDARMAFPVAKSLSKAGHTVHAGVSIFSNYLEWSRYIDASFSHPSLEPGDDLALPFFQDWLNAHPEIDTLQPVSEGGLRFLTRHRRDFERRARLIMASEDAVKTASNKTAMFELCERIKAPLAKYHRVTSMLEIESALVDIGFPLIIKPSKVDAPLVGRKALILHAQKELDAKLTNWPEEHPELLVQKYIRGPRHSVIFSADKGKLLGAVEIRAARTHENDGTGYTTYGVTIDPTPAIKRSVEDIVKALNYSTTGCAQYVVDPETGELTFMEVNPRVSLGRISECAGLPHSLWGLQLAHGEPVKGFSDPWATKRGVEYVWTKGELNLILSLFNKREISLAEGARRAGQMIRDALKCHHAIFEATDPLPAIGVYANKLIAPFRKHRFEALSLASGTSAAQLRSVGQK